MKRRILILITAIILVFSLSASVTVSANFNDESEIVNKLYSHAYYMISLDDETELFSKNENSKVAPAGFTKLLAAVVAIEQWNDLDDKITITADSLSVFESGFGIRTASLKAGEVYTKRQLIDCLIIYSPNDVASVIVQNIAGTKEEYLKMMNQLLSKIGCNNTNIIDIVGFDAEGQYTTAKDIATLIRYALKYPVFAEAFSQKTVTMPATGLNNERTYQGNNKMFNSAISDYYHSSVNGGKYTSTTEAGECIAVTTSKDGYSYLAVVMKGRLENIDDDSMLENTCMADAKKMIEWVYKNIFFKVVASPGQIVYSTGIQAGKGTDTLNLTPEKEISVLAPSKVSSYSVLVEPISDTLPDKIKAPVKKGDVICRANVLYANKKIAEINLVASENIGLSLPGLLMSWISAVIMSKVFIAVEIIAIFILLGFLLVKLDKIRKEKEKQKLRIVGGRSMPISKSNSKKRPTNTKSNKNNQNRQKNNTKQ